MSQKHKTAEQFEFRISLDPVVSREIAKKSTAKLSDEQVKRKATEILNLVEPFLNVVQENYVEGARTEHEQSEEKKLFDESAGSIMDTLEAVIDSVEHFNGEDILNPSENEYQQLEKLLSAFVVLCYPCWELSDELTDRQIVHFGLEILEKHPVITMDQHKLLSPLVKNVFCLRESTNEHLLQTKIFSAIERLCLVAAKLLKKIKAHDAALQWLEITQILKRRNASYKECLTAMDAADVVSRIKAAFSRMRLEVLYNTL